MKLGALRDILAGKDGDLEIAFNAHDSWGTPGNWSDLNTVSSAPPSAGLPGVIVFDLGRPWPRRSSGRQSYGYYRGEDIAQNAPDGRP